MMNLCEIISLPHSLTPATWYSTYMAQDPLPLREHADQRLPYIRSELPNSMDRENSEMFHHHVQLSDYGLQVLHCNHTMRAPLVHRVARVRMLWDKLVAW